MWKTSPPKIPKKSVILHHTSSIDMPNFAHLHCHTQFSLLDGAASIPALYKKAAADGMKGIAITDHGNMFGVFQFVAEAAKHEGVKPIVGCEFYVVTDRHRKTFTKEDKDKRFHQLLLAKNPEGYKNLVKLSSMGFIEGLYGKYPRIDKELIVKHHKGLIATTCCIGAMVPQIILRHGEETARKEFEWWLDIFGEDYYIELQRHNMAEQEKVNDVLLRFAKDYNVKVICSNDSHYVDQKDSNAHDILLCINTGEKQATPAIREFMEEGTVMKNGRFAFWNDQFYFKTQAEMGKLFHDLPQALDNTLEIVDKIEPLKLKQDIMLPNFIVPTEFSTQDDYLRHITYEGAKERYKTITAEVEDRLNFELHTIKTMGFAGYFLIVADFIKAGRDLGVFIGPGRGSAAGSAVAYCIGITNIDPIKYQLLFERFLNPDRKSMPDIDTDFDDEGRQKVIDYVVAKYGKQQVAQIVTYGTMAAKMSIKDVARVLDLPLEQSNAMAKLVPDKPGISLKRVLTAPMSGEGSLAEKEGLVSEDLEAVKRLREFLDAEGTPESIVLREALILEGSVRGTGVHAAGLIIAPSDLTEIIPVATVKDSDLLLTQFDGSVIEDAGVIKMDFLGLKTLTIIRDALKLIKQNHGVSIVIDDVPLDDRKTYELYQRGETNGTFQFESAGMQKYLRDLKPDKFDDLIAMNALYRPGPLEYIPDFIARKHGRQAVTYDVPDMEEYLKDTFGICVTGDTLVHNALNGQSVRIDQLEHQTGEFLVQGVDADLQQTSGYLTHWVCNGTKPVFQVQLRNGSRVKMTANHRVLTEMGWQEIGHLQPGAHIALPRRLEALTNTETDTDILRLIAYLLSKGSANANQIRFKTTENEVNEQFSRLLSEKYPALHVESTPNEVMITLKGEAQETVFKNQCSKWISFKETSNYDPARRRVPPFVFSLNEEAIAQFLAALWDCSSEFNANNTFYKTFSEQFAYDTQSLLLRLGIQSSVTKFDYKHTRTNEPITAFRVVVFHFKAFFNYIKPYMVLGERVAAIGDPNAVDQVDRVSISILRQELAERWDGDYNSFRQKFGFRPDQDSLSDKVHRTRISVLQAGTWVEEYNLNKTARNLQVRWEEITAITPCGEALVYDITVEGIHNFVGNNVLLHNCVYQEQIMLLSQKLAGFSKGDADVLRKAMGKKQKAVLDKMKGQFVAGAVAKGHPADKLEKIWTDWEAFAAYAFNKSHSTCYAFVAYQTAYLKAHYPSEYMAAVLTHSQNNIEKITFFLEECKRMGLNVKSPDINESELNFAVNKKGDIRYGLGAVKGVGEAAVENLIIERDANGPFATIFDFMRRMNLRTVNKRVMESMVMAGAFDEYIQNRAVFFQPSDKYETFIEHLLKYGAAVQEDKAMSTNSLFGDMSDTVSIAEPIIPKAEPWNLLLKLQKEKDVVGIYLSGHPLDDFRYEWENFATSLDKIENFKGRKVFVAGFVSKAEHRISAKGTGWGRFTIQDYTGSLELTMFSDSYQKFRAFFDEGASLYIEGEHKQRFNSDEMEFRVSDVRLLESVGAEKTKSVTLRIPLEKIDNAFLDGLESICKTYKGRHELRVELIDFQNKEKVSLLSSARKVHVDNEFLQAVEKLGVECVVN